MSTIITSNDLSVFPLHIDDVVARQMSDRRELLNAIEAQSCKAFQTGKCAKGASCEFRHSRGVKEGQCCKHYMRQLCKKGDLCEFLHIYDMSKMPECQFFRDYGVCGNSEECVFLHVAPEAKIRECVWYQRGFCAKGPSCKHAHTRRELCPRYFAGFCYLGPQCPLSHPKHDSHKHDTEPEAPLPAVRTEHMGGMTSGGMGMGGRGDGDYSRDRGHGHGHGHGGRRPPMNMQNVTCYKCKQIGHFASSCPN